MCCYDILAHVAFYLFSSWIILGGSKMNFYKKNKYIMPAFSVVVILVIAFAYTNMSTVDTYRVACQAEPSCRAIVTAMLQARANDRNAGVAEMTAGEMLQLASHRFGYGISSIEPSFVPSKLPDTPESLNQIAWIIFSQVKGMDPTLVGINLASRDPQAGARLSQGFAARFINGAHNNEVTLGFPCFDFNKMKVNGLYNFRAVSSKSVAEELHNLRLRNVQCNEAYAAVNPESVGGNNHEKTRVMAMMERTAKGVQLFNGVFGTQYQFQGQTRDLQINYDQVLHEYWFNRFNVEYAKLRSLVGGNSSYEDLIDAHKTRDFRALLGAVTKSQSMLNYLDNDQNRYVASTGAASNQNLGREILELHSLGIGPSVTPGDSPYNQMDVEVASTILAGHSALNTIREGVHYYGYVFDIKRAFTGSLRTKYWTSLAATARPLFFNEALLTSLDAAPTIERRLDVMLDALANNEFTGRSICSTMARRFSNNSAFLALRAACISAYKSGTDATLKQLEKVALSFPSTPQMWSRGNYRTMWANPLEVVTQNIRAVGIKWQEIFADTTGVKAAGLYNFMDDAINTMGLTYKEIGFPTGYEMNGSFWLSQGYLLSHSRLAFSYAHLDRILNVGSAIRNFTTSSTAISDLQALLPLTPIERQSGMSRLLYSNALGKRFLLQQANSEYLVTELVSRVPSKTEDREFIDSFINSQGTLSRSMPDTVLSFGLSHTSMLRR